MSAGPTRTLIAVSLCPCSCRSFQGFGPGPELFELGEGQTGQLPALVPGGFFHRREAPAEPFDGGVQRALGIDAREPGDVDDREEQIAQLVAERVAASLAERLRDLAELLVDLLE